MRIPGDCQTLAADRGLHREHVWDTAAMLGGRSPGFVLRQAVEPENYRALLRMRKTVLHPLDFAGRYFFGRGDYPARCQLRTPAGMIAPTVYSHHDVFTVNEIFCRLDYRLPVDARTVVDIGSNIGISALYFLTRSPSVHCHLFEPDPRNVERLRGNLDAYQGRFTLTEAAVADHGGRVSFGRESSGRYGGVGLRHADEIEVDCLDINDVLRGVLDWRAALTCSRSTPRGLRTRPSKRSSRICLLGWRWSALRPLSRSIRRRSALSFATRPTPRA